LPWPTALACSLVSAALIGEIYASPPRSHDIGRGPLVTQIQYRVPPRSVAALFVQNAPGAVPTFEVPTGSQIMP
jgi:hypothetical protein